MTIYTDELDDGFGVADTFGSPVLGVTVGEGVGFHGNPPLFQFQAGGLVSEGLGFRHTQATGAIYGVAVAEALGMLDSFLSQFQVSLLDGVGFQASLTVARAVAVLEGLGFADQLAPTHYAQLMLADAVTFSDSLLDFFGLGAAEGVGFADSFQAIFQYARSVGEGVGFADTLTSTGLFMRVITDGLDFDDSLIPQMIFDGQLSDTLGLKIGWLDPGGGFTAWAINTRTNAVTEYQNWNFNSFCLIGGQVYGGSDAGLFVLNAETDNGADIVTDIKGAMLSLGGSRFTQLDGVYIGMRVESNSRNFILKLIQPNAGPGGTDRVYVYQFRPANMKTTKINIGKGLRARYLQWELITPGPDFDLDSIEFVPVLSKRRV